MWALFSKAPASPGAPSLLEDTEQEKAAEWGWWPSGEYDVQTDQIESASFGDLIKSFSGGEESSLRLWGLISSES